MMAELHKQSIAEISLNQDFFINLIYEDGFTTEETRIWGTKEVKRYFFRAENDGGEFRFECSPYLADKIVQNIELTLSDKHVDLSNVDRIRIHVCGRNVKIDLNSLPIKRGFFRRIWEFVRMR